MTIWQIVALLIGGPVVLWNLVILASVFINKKGTYTLTLGIMGVISIVAILVSFLGIK